MPPLKDDDEEILLPKKKPKPLTPSSSSKKPSPPMMRLIRITRTIGMLLGGGVTLVGLMGVVGMVTGNFWARLLVALVLLIGVPAVVADRLLKRTKLGGGLGMVGDVFAIVLLALALLLVGAEFLSRPLFVGEGDHYARSGSRAMARLAYWLGGVTPVFPEERGLPAQIGPGAPASASGSAAVDGGVPDAGKK